METIRKDGISSLSNSVKIEKPKKKEVLGSFEKDVDYVELMKLMKFSVPYLRSRSTVLVTSDLFNRDSLTYMFPSFSSPLSQ